MVDAPSAGGAEATRRHHVDKSSVARKGLRDDASEARPMSPVTP